MGRKRSVMAREGERGAAAKSPAERQRDSRAASKRLKTCEARTIAYDPPQVTISGLGLVEEDCQFIKALQANPDVTPLITSDVLLQKLEDLRKKSKIDLVAALPDILLHPPRYDAVLVRTEDELRRALDRAYSLVRGEARSSHQLTRTFGWTFQRQYDVMPHSCGPAHQPARQIDADGNSTYMVDSVAFRRAFIGTDVEREEERGSNFLDIANFSGHSFFPGAIRDVSLVHRLEIKTNKSPWDRVNAGARTPDQDWIICTKSGSVSPWHTDYAGYNTCVVGLVNRKIWYVPRGDAECLRKQLQMKDSRETNWTRGVSVTEIGPGDCLIMPPGTIHAVYTPDDCMVAGCFFWTVPTFARSIFCIRHGLRDTIRSNDDLGVAQYQLLTYVFNHIDVEGVWTEDALAEVWVEVGRLLEQQKVITWDDKRLEARKKEGWKQKPKTRAKTMRPSKPSQGGRLSALDRGEKEAQIVDALNEWLWACLQWWWARYEHSSWPEVGSDASGGDDGYNRRGGKRSSTEDWHGEGGGGSAGKNGIDDATCKRSVASQEQGDGGADDEMGQDDDGGGSDSISEDGDEDEDDDYTP